MEKLTAFLEEELMKSPEILVFDKASGSRFIDAKKLEEHDTRLINTLLDIVGEEIEKKRIKSISGNNGVYNEIVLETVSLDDIKQILTNLKK